MFADVSRVWSRYLSLLAATGGAGDARRHRAAEVRDQLIDLDLLISMVKAELGGFPSRMSADHPDAHGRLESMDRIRLFSEMF